MAYSLPPIRTGEFVTFEHFPDPLCTFVYRNWNTLPASVLAETVNATEEQINTLAAEMGLPVPATVDVDWRTYGYITLIRANWHLLTYEQYCTMLGWDMEKLAFIIKEDDFLEVKLGNQKPDVEPLLWHELTKEQHEALIPIKKATEEFLAAVGPQSAKPFSFEPFFSAVQPADIMESNAEPRLKDRIVYSYCALYGDTFTNEVEYSFPDSLLKAYQAVGVNGIWCQAILYTLVPFPFDESLSEGWQERLAGLRKLTDRMAKYGIRLFLYLNEPRWMPIEFFDKYPHLKGATFSMGPNGTGTQGGHLCTSTPEIQKYLYDSAALLAREAPNLGGFFTITGTENHSNCYSHSKNGMTNCPRCQKRPRADVLAEVNELLYKGAKSENPNIRMLSWTWAWNEDTHDAIRKLPDGVSVLTISERAIPKKVGPFTYLIGDYSMSVVGPGENAKSDWKVARECGLGAAAKCQFNNTWECSFVPFLPVYELIYKHVQGLCAEGIDSALLDWTLGGYPSPTFAMLYPLFYKTDKMPTLRELYESVFTKEAADVVEKACALFSSAFEEFPFSVGVAYQAPQNVGTSNLLYPTPTGFGATMTGIPYDDTHGWTSVFTEEVVQEQFRLVSEGWAKGLEVLRAITPEQIASSHALSMLIDCAEAAYCHFRSSYLQFRFTRVRDEKEEGDLVAIAKEEEALVLRLSKVQARNPTIGFESTNHYFYSRAALMEKYVNCKYVQSRFSKN